MTLGDRREVGQVAEATGLAEEAVVVAVGLAAAVGFPAAALREVGNEATRTS